MLRAKRAEANVRSIVESLAFDGFIFVPRSFDV